MNCAAYQLTFRHHLGEAASVGRLLSVDGAIRTGHYRLLSGQHSDRFLAFSAIAADPAELDLITTWLAPTVEAWSPDAVLAPATAGVGLAATLASRLSVPLYLASSGQDGRPDCLLGRRILRGSRILLVNDVTTTGTALGALADLVLGDGGVIVGASWFASRSMTAEPPLPFPAVRVADLDLPSWPADQCSLCRSSLDIEDARDLN